MSRGLGVAQRFVLDVLAGHADRDPWERWSSAQEIAHARSCGGRLVRHVSEWDGEKLTFAYYECDRCGVDTPVPVAAVESVRRAMRTLAKKEIVEPAWIQAPGVGGGTAPEWSRQLHARLPLTEDEFDREKSEGKRPDVLALLPWGTIARVFSDKPAKEATDG